MRYDDPLMNTGDYKITELARFARQYVSSDPSSCIIKQGLIIEYIMSKVINKVGLQNPTGWNDELAVKLLKLQDNGYINHDIYSYSNMIRKYRNKAAHQLWSDHKVCEQMFFPLEEICLWYTETNQKQIRSEFCLNEHTVAYLAENQEVATSNSFKNQFNSFSFSKKSKAIIKELGLLK